LVGFAVTTTALAPATATFGAAYSAALATTNGTGAVRWKLVAGAMPRGLRVNAAAGVISGTVTKAKRSPVSSVYTFTIKATDHAKPTSHTATMTYTLTVS